MAVTGNGRVTIQRSTRSNLHFGDYCPGAHGFMFIHEAVPEAWWRYRNWTRAHSGLDPLPIDHEDVDGPRLLDSAGMPDEPVSPTRHWSFRTDFSDELDDAIAVQEDLDFIDKHLTWAMETLARRGLELIEPARYLKELLNQPDKGVGDWEPIVVFLSEYGPSSALDEAIEELRGAVGAETAEPVVEYARSR